jgi:hypothetical protein
MKTKVDIQEVLKNRREEKLNLIASRIRGVKIGKYSAELDIIKQNATRNPKAQYNPVETE